MSLNYLPIQAPSARNIFLDRQKPESAMVLSTPVVEPKNSFPSLPTSGQTNELAAPVSYSTSPIPPMGLVFC
jgi:hypothetical protein